MYMRYIISSLHPSDMYNAYILAVDGDVSFLPADVIRLAQALQTKREVGAICGRIYPTGSGLVLWFQAVEYAISHWLYKSTEALVGNVLCCPGCFTMYRASALNSNDLLTSYASNTKNAIDHLMQDQGEDRWLTTLVLKSGYQTSYAQMHGLIPCARFPSPSYKSSNSRRWYPLDNV
ncbi:PREDICTED: chitin synthase 6-like [Priapulus caudatus]|uniref:chitin synthase n=1 Tax=Priapulus caudatus TaxID=37621 RepID=A0ABM1F3T9_PRICU|nr:PREDICTED: chitin synthase 6-like [Priapulus caudatus]